MLRTKVVATLGPSTSTPEIIEQLIRAGVNIARINMSHGDYEEHDRNIRYVRQVSRRLGRPTAVLVDLRGPKIRVGYLPEPIFLAPGSTVVMAPEGSHMDGEIPTSYASLAEEIQEGHAVLLDDGLLELRCVAVRGDRVVLEVIRGGILKSKKGLNLPSLDVNTESLTAKDLRDLEFALEHHAEFVGLSFVRRAADVRELKRRVKGRALVVAKIEKARALDELEDVLVATDAVMVARGDLGVELPYEQVPLAQKRIIETANFYGRPVITATQMLESMTDYPRPTRAEASDVANAILDGTDAVMLSGETAAGRFPIESVKAIVKIAREIERSGFLERGPNYLGPRHTGRRGASSREHAIASSTVSSARQLEAPAIIVITRTGFAARLVSSYRPPMPIFAICTSPGTYGQLAGVWGVFPVLAEKEELTYENLTQVGRRAVVAEGVGQPGESVVVTAGFPFNTAGTTNTMRVEEL